MAAAARRTGAAFVHMSTDYVFDGTAREPYPEDATQQPTSAYGRTKLAGEEAVMEFHPEGTYVVRTAWLYGVNGANFVKTMLRLEGARDEVAVVDDQVGQPTWSRDLADLILRLVRADAAPGIYHGTSQGRTSWFGFTQAIFKGVGADPARVSPTTTDAFPRPAARPAFSVLGHDRLEAAGVEPIRRWDEALDEALPLIQQRFISEQ